MVLPRPFGPTLFFPASLFVALAGFGVRLRQLYAVLGGEVLRGLPMRRELVLQVPEVHNVPPRPAREAEERVAVYLEGAALRGLLFERTEARPLVALVFEFGKSPDEFGQVYL